MTSLFNRDVIALSEVQCISNIVFVLFSCSPLHLAAARGLKKEAELLVHNNADIYLITRDDYDVFELSAHSKSRRMIAYLRKKDDEKRQKRKSHQHRVMN